MTQSWRYAMHKMEISDTLGIVGLLHRFRSSATTLTSLQEGEPSPHQRGTPGTDYIYHPGCNQVTWIFWIFNRNIQPGWTPLPLCLHRGQHPIFQRYSAILGSLAKTWSHKKKQHVCISDQHPWCLRALSPLPCHGPSPLSRILSQTPGNSFKTSHMWTHPSMYLPHLDHFLDVNCAGTVPVVKLERPVQFVPEWSVFGSWECSIF